MLRRPLNSTAPTSRTGAVVVFYNPDAACIERANRLATKMHCVVVDNTPEMRPASALGLASSIEYLPNGQNAGIATAINQGVEALIRGGFEMAIIFDQDSEPPASLFVELPKVIEAANASGKRVALVGPAYSDARLSGLAPFVRFQWLSLQREELSWIVYKRACAQPIGRHQRVSSK